MPEETIETNQDNHLLERITELNNKATRALWIGNEDEAVRLVREQVSLELRTSEKNSVPGMAEID